MAKNGEYQSTKPLLDSDERDESQMNDAGKLGRELW